jgi:hypothetical protein
MVHGLAVAVLAQGGLRRLAPIADCPLEVPAVLEVHRELARDLARARAVRPFQARADAEMEADAVPDRDARVQDVAIQCVDEAVAGGDCSIRPPAAPRRG